MNLRRLPFLRAVQDTAPRVGLFGLLGSGNIGNDASMETVLAYLRNRHPEATVDAMCAGPEQLRKRYGIEAVPLSWYRPGSQRSSRPVHLLLTILGKAIDAFRTAAWVRRHDAVIVPGMGALEASLPLRPWETPYAMFLLSATGRAFGTRVAFVSVGANMINQWATLWLFNAAARLAFYRSYRDIGSRDAMNRRGIDTSNDQVYPDLVFGLPVPTGDPGDERSVGIGLMTYYGTNDDRQQQETIHSAYLAKMKTFVRWLVDDGRRVRLLVGDTTDAEAVQEILADLRSHRPKLDPAAVVAEPISSFNELTQAIAPVGTVVATRFHNVMCALKLGKPTVSLGYTTKNIALMSDAGLAEFCQPANSFDVGRLIEQFTEVQEHSAQLRQRMTKHNIEMAQLLDKQFTILTELLFPTSNQRRYYLHRPRRTRSVPRWTT